MDPSTTSPRRAGGGSRLWLVCGLDTVCPDDEAVHQVRVGAGLQRHHIPVSNRLYRPIRFRPHHE